MAVRWIDRDAESVLRWRPLRHDGSLRRTFSRLDAPSVVLIDEDPDPTVDRVPDPSIDALVLSALGCGSVFVGAFRRLATKLIGHEYPNAGSIRFSAGTKEVRAYKVEDDLVVDSTGVKGSFRAAGKDIGPMIEQRKRNLCDDE